MSEHVLRIALHELATVRIKQDDGTTLEMPIERLANYSLNPATDLERQALTALGKAIATLSKKSSVDIEFVIRQPTD